MAEVTIRPATPDDAAAITRLVQTSYPRLMAAAYDPDMLAVALPLMAKANPKLLASGTYYLAQTAAGRAVGVGGWTHDRPGTGETASGLAHIRHFATHPDHTGQGIARAIYQTCETAARAAAVTTFECYSSLNAEPFYAAMGFRVIRRVDIPMSPQVNLPAILMRRNIETDG